MEYYFIGIKGSGMSPLAQILHDLGNKVSGSDVSKFFFTQKKLEERGIEIKEFNINNLKNIENKKIIVGNAFNSKNNIEVEYCENNNIDYIRYTELLSSFVQKYKSVAVSGAHGKTTTTGLLSHVLNEIDSSNYLIGDGTGFGNKESNNFVFEACEYKRHFLLYEPNYTIITNIDFDHPDYFKDINDVTEAFKSFSDQTKDLLIICGDDENSNKINHKKETIKYGFNLNNDLIAKNIKVENNKTKFEVYYKNEFIDLFEINLFGKHQVLNTLAVLAICIKDKFDLNKVKEALLTYDGVKRRFSEIAVENNVIVDDYAHHPTEIKATIDTAKQKYPNKKIISVFQPHTFTRTKKFLDDFSNSFTGSDEIYLTDIFGSARENSGELNIHDLIEKTNNAEYINKELIYKLKNKENSVILFMGAGNVNELMTELINIKKQTLVN